MLRPKAKPVSAGDLTEIVSIEAETVAADGYGGRSRSWAQHLRAWAKIAPIAAREVVDGGDEVGDRGVRRSRLGLGGHR
jgi:head-tail adaptor